ncbi:MAG TPA: CheW domain-containing protein [Armatimonadaceae bacterium]|nr:CheW domain-containing protein [Armatimonadaceae bacterium]
MTPESDSGEGSPGSASDERRAGVWRQRAQTIRARKTRANAVVGESPARTVRCLIARSSGQLYAFPLEAVAEVLETAEEARLCPVPDAPPAFWSLVVVRGEVRPVFDARAILPGNPGPESDRAGNGTAGRHLIMLRPSGSAAATVTVGGDFGEHTVGLVVDRIEETVAGRVESLTGVAADSTLLTGHLTVPGSDATALVIDIPALLRLLRGESDPAESIELADHPSPEERDAEESANR